MAGTFERFNYALRPAKNIERKMICEALSRLPRIAPLSSYRYVGFGALGFCDFCLFHQRLGINDMLSIEGYTDAQERVQNNIPYSCIQMRWGTSHVVLPTLDWAKRTILWLDYDDPISQDMLKDVALAAGSLASGSVLLVTVPADPGAVEENVNMAEKRLLQLESRVGKSRVPNGLAGTDLAKWGTARTLRTILVTDIEAVLSDRSAPLEGSDKLHFRQLFNFHYADGVKMLTVGGLIVNGTDEAQLGAGHFADLEFCCATATPYLIEAPLLTWREIKLLDADLPGSAPDVAAPAWIPEAERRKYGRVYRYFPSFGEVEI